MTQSPSKPPSKLSRSLSSSVHSIEYTPQHFLTYLQSIKTFEHFDQSTIILQSQPPQIESSLNIRITEHQHIPLYEFISDCILISQLHNNNDFKSKLNNSTLTSIISITDIISLTSNQKSNKSFLLSFYNQFLHFLSILTQIFDENIVTTKLRIRGPYLLMTNEPFIKNLCTFLLSQLIIIQNNMNLYSNSDMAKYEMTLKEMKNLRYIINFIKNLLQFELYTAQFLQLKIISNMILFDQNEQIKNWSKSLAKLFGVILMIKLPTNSLTNLEHYDIEKLKSFENKAVLATKRFRSFIISFIRFLIIHYDNIINKEYNFNHLDVIINELFNINKFKYNCDIINDLWDFDKLEHEYKIEYEIKQKYQSSAFLKGKSVMEMDENNLEHENDIQMLDNKSKLIKQRSNEMDITNENINEFIREECYIIILEKVLPFCMDFNIFYDVICENKYKLYNEIIYILNDMLLYFIDKEKWWYLSYIMNIYNDLFENKIIFTEFINNINNKKDIELNIKYGIYSYIIWICYIHQITPKPVICFFDNDFDVSNALQMDTETRRQKLINAENNKHKMFETLPNIQQRITELCLAEAVLIKLFITMDEWLVNDIINNFIHIRDKFVIVKLLMILLRDCDWLIEKDVLDFESEYKKKYLKIFYKFKHNILNKNSNVMKSNNNLNDSGSPKHTMKTKIVFKKIKSTNKIRKKNYNENVNAIKEQKCDNETVTFKHFTTHSMKIVNCIIENKKHLLYQFVTGNKSSKSSSNSKTNSVKIISKHNSNIAQNISAPPPPVFSPFDDDNVNSNNNNLGFDISLLSSTLSSIQTALDVPQPQPQAQEYMGNMRPAQVMEPMNDNDDFDFDFNRISNNRRKPAPVSPAQAYFGGYGQGYAQPQVQQQQPLQQQTQVLEDGMNNYGNPPPMKKRKVNSNGKDSSEVSSEQLSDLLAYLCDKKGDDSGKGDDGSDKVSGRYPKPKAPTMKELNTAEKSKGSNWTNVVDLNRY